MKQKDTTHPVWRPLRNYLFVLVVIACITGWSGWQISQASARASKQATERQTVEQLAASFHEAQNHETQTAQSRIGVTDLIQTIETSARTCGIDPVRQFVRIEPLPIQQITDQPYAIRATRIELRQLQLQPLLRWLEHLREEPRLLIARELRLQAPHDDILGKTWNVELVLQRLVYQSVEPPEKRVSK